MKQFDHIGIITTEPQPGESWDEFSKVWVTHPPVQSNSIEYIRPLEMPLVDPSQVGLWRLWNLPHVAYRVDDLAKAIEGEEVLLGPFEPGDFGPVVFIHKDGVVIEYLQYH